MLRRLDPGGQLAIGGVGDLGLVFYDFKVIVILNGVVPPPSAA
jgi:hypothetical protein